MSGVDPGPLSLWAQHLRNVADQLDSYQPTQMEPIPISWVDTTFEQFMAQGTAVETRDHLRRKFFGLMTTAGITDKEAQLEVIEEILGRRSRRTQPVTSRADLTIVELGRICQALEDWEKIEGYAS